MNFFPNKQESETEVIVYHPYIGLFSGFALLLCAYFFSPYIGGLSAIFALAGYVLLSIYGYRSFTQTKVIRTATKAGVDANISGRVFSIKDPVVYSLKKSRLAAVNQ